MGERLAERWQPRHHLEDDFGQVHPGNHCRGAPPQIHQAGRVRHCGQRRNVQLAVLVHARRSVLTEASAQLSVGAVETLGQLTQQRARIVRQSKGIHAGLACGLPPHPRQQMCTRVPPFRGVFGEDVAVLQVPVELLEHTQCVGGTVHGALGPLGRIHQALPATADQLVIDAPRVEPAGGQPAGALWGDQLSQRVHGREHRFRIAGGPEIDGAHHRGQEGADRGEPPR